MTNSFMMVCKQTVSKFPQRITISIFILYLLSWFSANIQVKYVWAFLNLPEKKKGFKKSNRNSLSYSYLWVFFKTLRNNAVLYELPVSASLGRQTQHHLLLHHHHRHREDGRGGHKPPGKFQPCNVIMNKSARKSYENGFWRGKGNYHKVLTYLNMVYQNNWNGILL